MVSPHLHVPYHRLSGHAGFLNSHKANIELYFNGAALDSLRSSDIKGIRAGLDYNPEFSIHAPFMDLSPGAVDSKVRDATLARFHQVFDIAGILLPRVIVFHSGYEKWRYGLNMDLWLEMSLLTWLPLLKMADEIGTKIAIENIFEDGPENLRLLMEEMASPSFGVCFDTGHFNLFSRTPLEDWTGALAPYIVELHLHDNGGTMDQHLPMGEGSFDFTRFFGLLGNRACLHTLEAHTEEHALRSLRYYREITGAGAGSSLKNP
ncbi:MAG: sugar phosphate isomerase/epimerase [Nitrospirae bacterium]|nr:sugar phosphate isomerase/epimerase [Nitrospirota bacterium]